jgi:hypothetical protein
MRELVTEPALLARHASAGRASVSACFTHEAVAIEMGTGLGFRRR